MFWKLGVEGVKDHHAHNYHRVLIVNKEKNILIHMNTPYKYTIGCKLFLISDNET